MTFPQIMRCQNYYQNTWYFPYPIFLTVLKAVYIRLFEMPPSTGFLLLWKYFRKRAMFSGSLSHWIRTDQAKQHACNKISFVNSPYMQRTMKVLI